MCIRDRLDPETLREMPAVASWLTYAETARRVVRENYKDLEGVQLLSACVQENVLAQIENLKTHPAVAARLGRGEVNLHAWVYKIETGMVFSFDPDAGQFTPLTESSPAAVPMQRRTTISI